MGKRYKCPYCELRDERKKLIIHIDKRHEEMLPEGYDGARIMYDKINHTDGHGTCRVCKKPTLWNYKAQRYDTLCSNPKCKEAMREEYKKNMLRVRGTYNILNDPQQQEKMLANRSISGKYKFRDGGIVTYTGSYEKKFLEFIDNVMEISSKDILMPGPTIEYQYKGEKHFYITDCLYIPFNAIIEIKDGGDNPNNKSTPGMIASREKTVQKEKIITDRGEYNYIRLTNNEFTQLIEFFMEIKEKMLNDDPSMTIRIHETSVSSELNKNYDIVQESKSPYAIITDNITITKSYGYTSPKNGIYNAIVDVNASIRARGRSELLVIKNDEVYLSKSKRGLCGDYSIPGGGWDLNESHDKSAIREAEEEARLKTKNVKYADRYLSLYDEPHDWIKREIPEEYQWRGYYTEVYVGEYAGKYSGKIRDVDKDDIIKTGKFYKIKDVFDELHPIHQNAILNYLALPKNESNNFLQENNYSFTKNIRYIDYRSADAKKYIESDSFLKRIYGNRQNEYNGEIAVDGDNVVGYVFIGDKTDKGFINSLFVDSKYRKRGIATRLFNDAMHKYGGYDLTVKKNNKIAINMYRNKGFVFVGNGNSSSEYYMKLKSHLSNDEKKMVLDESYLLEDSIDSINKSFVDDFKKYINENPKGYNKEIKPLGTPITYTAKKKNEKWLLLATYNGKLNKKTSSSFLPQLQKNVKYNGENIEYHTCYLPGDIYIFIKLPNGGK